MKKVLFILLIVICIVQLVRTQECAVTETEAAGLAYQTLRLGLADTQSRSLVASAIRTTLWLLPPPTPNMAGSMQLWQLFEGGAGIDPARILEVERYWNEYYAAQQRAADTFANQQRWKTVREEIKTDVGVEIGEGFPQWAINAMNAGGTGQGNISNPYDSVLGRQGSQIRETSGTPTSRLNELNANLTDWLNALTPGSEANMTLTSGFQRIPPSMFGLGRYDSMLLSAQLALEGYGVTAETQAKIDRYFEQYYAAQERAIRNAAKRARPIPPEEMKH